MELDIILEQEIDGAYSVQCPALKGNHSILFRGSKRKS